MNAPVDRGQLRSSLTSDVESIGANLQAFAGSPLFYAPYMEFGTGTQSDAPGASRRRHWPPAGALNLWAQRHGVKGGGAAVAYFIGRRGGLKAKKFLRNAFTKLTPRIEGEVGKILGDIINYLAD